MRLFFAKIDRDDFLFVWEPRWKWSAKTVTALCHDLNLVHCVDPLEKPSLYGGVRYFGLHGGADYRHQHSDDEPDRLNNMAIGETCVLFNHTTMRDDALRFIELTKKGRT